MIILRCNFEGRPQTPVCFFFCSQVKRFEENTVVRPLLFLFQSLPLHPEWTTATQEQHEDRAQLKNEAPSPCHSDCSLS